MRPPVPEIPTPTRVVELPVSSELKVSVEPPSWMPEPVKLSSMRSVFVIVASAVSVTPPARLTP